MKTKIPRQTALEDKTAHFMFDVRDYDSLNAEQKRIYNAFVYRRAKPYNFEVTDAYGNTIRFKLYTNKTDDGVLHIMGKHYRGAVGAVTTQEILNLCDVVRYGEMKPEANKLTYSWRKGNSTLVLIVGLKKSKEGGNILKSFYSNRKTSRTAGSSNK